ncbi:MAG: sensor domain-containing diguanylate cyclase [Candidatus Sericytochromatia bacterium]|nr:sensor domain-containing diguanylate cyclase [Candidatus Sericytochromatia bacterium]
MPRPRRTKQAWRLKTMLPALALWSVGFIGTYGASLATFGFLRASEPWIPVLSGLSTAAIFHALGRRRAGALGPVAAHLKADERLARALDAAQDPEQVAALLVGTIHKTLNPVHASVWLLDPERHEFRLATGAGIPTDREALPEEQVHAWLLAAAGASEFSPEELVAVRDLDHWLTRHSLAFVEPLYAHGASVGLLTLGPRSDGRPWGAGERWLINRALREAGLAIALISLERTDRTRRSRMDTLAQRYKDAQQRAVTDGLTGLGTHVYFKEQLWQRFHEARRHNAPLSVMLIDVDHFKRINDTFGHPVGDEVLRLVSRTVKDAARGGDVVARYGGEELVVAMPRTDLAGATILAERVREAVEALEPLDGRGRPISTVTVSVGVAELVAKDATPEDLVARTDAALYVAKHEGRNLVRQAVAAPVAGRA